MLLKSRERLARIAFLNATLCALYIFALACKSERGILSPAVFGSALLLYAVAPFHWVVGYFFYSALPFQLSGGGYWRVFGRVLLIWGTILWIPLTFSRVILVVPGEWAYTVAMRYPMLMGLLGEPLRVAFRTFIVICIIGILSSVVSKYRSLAEGDLRRLSRSVSTKSTIFTAPVRTTGARIMARFCRKRRSRLDGYQPE